MRQIEILLSSYLKHQNFSHVPPETVTSPSYLLSNSQLHPTHLPIQTSSTTDSQPKMPSAVSRQLTFAISRQRAMSLFHQAPPFSLSYALISTLHLSFLKKVFRRKLIIYS